MIQYINKADVKAEIEKLEERFTNQDNEFSDGYHFALKLVLSFLDTLETKDVDLEKDVNEIIKTAEDHAYFVGSENTRKNLWHPADGDDLPEIDREVIALVKEFGHHKVVFAHRVDENAEVHTSVDGKPLVLHPMKYDKGGWNLPDIKWWLDLELPKMEE